MSDTKHTLSDECTQGVGGTAHSIVREYRDWIRAYENNLDTDPTYIGDNWTLALKMKGMCLSACKSMLATFPSLRLVRGWVVGWDLPVATPVDPNDSWMDPGNGHFWLETVDGLIVDPTAAQFGSAGRYCPLDESKAHALPTGKCPNCGDYCYGGRDLCSDDCERSYAAYIQAETRSGRW